MKHFLTLQLSTIFILLLHGRACDKIVGGKEAKPHSRPYMMYIVDKKKICCEGILIKPNWALTAAHCNISSEATVVLGVHEIGKTTTDRQIRKIKRRIRHELYLPYTMDYDVELLQLCKEAAITKTVKPLALPKNCDEPVAGTVCQVAGWGSTTNQNDDTSDKLMEANVTIMDRKSCYNKWKHNKQDSKNISENMICTCEQEVEKEPCKGDSGGPLICNGMLQGIISFGDPDCGAFGNAAVYTFLNRRIICWIYKQLSGLP